MSNFYYDEHNVKHDRKSGLPLVHVTKHSETEKLAGIHSISTNMQINPCCQARRNIDGCICKLCFANPLLNCRGNLNRATRSNYAILNERLLTDEEIALIHIDTAFFRIESFGDVASTICAINYIRIMYANPDVKFGAWSKNYNFWFNAFDKVGKPDNCSFVYSSPMINSRITIEELTKLDSRAAKYVDHIFTVYDKQHYAAAIVEFPDSACAGISCKYQCGCKCYKRNTTMYIRELLRK